MTTSDIHTHPAVLIQRSKHQEQLWNHAIASHMHTFVCQALFFWLLSLLTGTPDDAAEAQQAACLQGSRCVSLAASAERVHGGKAQQRSSGVGPRHHQTKSSSMQKQVIHILSKSMPMCFK